MVYPPVVPRLGVPPVFAEIGVGKHVRADGGTAFARLAPAFILDQMCSG